jgi:1,4-dihydroxy-2-naphthoyl-CoA hydrolase
MKNGSDAGAIRDLLAAEREQGTALLGITVTEIAPGRVVGTLTVGGKRRSQGLRHGAAACVLAETLGSIAAALHAGPGRASAAVDLNATYHRAARGGLVTGVCTPLHEGRTIATYEIVVTDDEGRLVCMARFTSALRDCSSADPSGRRE